MTNSLRFRLTALYLGLFALLFLLFSRGCTRVLSRSLSARMDQALATEGRHCRRPLPRRDEGDQWRCALLRRRNGRRDEAARRCRSRSSKAPRSWMRRLRPAAARGGLADAAGRIPSARTFRIVASAPLESIDAPLARGAAAPFARASPRPGPGRRGRLAARHPRARAAPHRSGAGGRASPAATCIPASKPAAPPRNCAFWWTASTICSPPRPVVRSRCAASSPMLPTNCARPSASSAARPMSRSRASVARRPNTASRSAPSWTNRAASRRLIEDLLNLARADAGHVQLQAREFYLNELLDRMLPIRAAARAEARACAWNATPATDLQYPRRRTTAAPPASSTCWTTRSATRRAGGTVSAAIESGPDGVRILVADTGIGISPDKSPRVFERFYRADEARSRAEGGFGLGLSIVRWIAEAHHGAVECASTPGAGSTFTVTLPA